MDEEIIGLEIMGTEYVPSAEELAANAVILQNQEQLKKDRIAETKARESALAKLAKLGLTPDEVQAITG